MNKYRTRLAVICRWCIGLTAFFGLAFDSIWSHTTVILLSYCAKKPNQGRSFKASIIIIIIIVNLHLFAFFQLDLVYLRLLYQPTEVRITGLDSIPRQGLSQTSMLAYMLTSMYCTLYSMQSIGFVRGKYMFTICKPSSNWLRRSIQANGAGSTPSEHFTDDWVS